MIHPRIYLKGKVSTFFVGMCVLTGLAVVASVFVVSVTPPPPEPLTMQNHDFVINCGRAESVKAPKMTPWTFGPLSAEQLVIPKHAKITKTGLATVILQEGDEGAYSPGPMSSVFVRMLGWSEDGKSLPGLSQLPMSPTRFPLKAVIPGFQEALEMMKPGERRRIWVPAHLGYKNMPGKPQGTLVFDVELVSFEE